MFDEFVNNKSVLYIVVLDCVVHLIKSTSILLVLLSLQCIT